MKEAGAQGVVIGVFNDAVPWPLKRIAWGAARRSRALQHRARTMRSRSPASATLRSSLSDGGYIGRRGMARGMAVGWGLRRCSIGGISSCVITNRQQCMEPMQLESSAVIGAARTVVVKSRGHFRAGFDEYFPPERTYEVDCPGLTSPNLATFSWTKLPRPVYPLDEHTSWTPPRQ